MRRMRSDIESLRRRRDTLSQQIQRAEATARSDAQAGHRARARQALLERDQFQTQLNQVEGVHTNLLAQMGAVETARTHASVAQSMRDGAALMAEAEQSLNGDQLHRDLIDMRTTQRRVDQVTRMMTRPMWTAAAVGGSEEEQHAIDDELEQLMQSATVATDGIVAPPTTPVPEDVVVENVRRVEEDMGL